MLNSFYVATLGMQAQKLQLDVVASNLSNANTQGYKRERVDFSAFLDRQMQVSHSEASADSAAIVRRWRDLSQGELKTTNSSLDIAINGAGFLEVALTDDRVGYVAGGSLRVSDEGYLTTATGYRLKPELRIPSTARDLLVDGRGVVTATLGSDTRRTELGRLQLVTFSNVDNLVYDGGGIFTARDNVAPSSFGYPDESGFGRIEAGKLEMSNVKLVEEMVQLMLAQRVYELNSKILQASDEMMALNNSLRRS
jgi:flagellar basal-body rod protein FlgG